MCFQQNVKILRTYRFQYVVDQSRIYFVRQWKLTKTIGEFRNQFCVKWLKLILYFLIWL